MRYATRARTVVCLLGTALLLACGSGADEGVGEPPAKWISLVPSSPAGSRARTTLEAPSCSATRTEFTVEIPGFWLVTMRGGDGRTYHQVEVPGLGMRGATGAPDLPAYGLQLATPTAAKEARVTRVQWEGVAVFDDVLVWPHQLPPTGEEDVTSEPFQRDPAIYDEWQGDWPPDDAVASQEVVKTLRSIPTARFTGYPVKWDPATRQLKVARRATYVCEHDGVAQTWTGTTMSKERRRLASHQFANWEIVGGLFPPVETYEYRADFLIVHPEGYEDALAPFVAQKRTRGFRVTEIPIPTPNTFENIHAAITSWQEGVSDPRDCYVLLVGDTTEIPFYHYGSQSSYDHLSDAQYQDGAFLGRLSVDSAADCANQVAKILAYEDTPRLECCYHRALLWADLLGPPDDFEAEYELVRTASYATPPTFVTYYGSQPGVRDADIVAEINGGVGLVAYYGRGSAWATAAGWNLAADVFNGADVAQITCPANQAVPVWSFSPSNWNLDMNDCIAEQWMAAVGTGAVCYYGSSKYPDSTADRYHVEGMFQAVYEHDLVTITHAIYYSEYLYDPLTGGLIAEEYNLLGDPDMQIRRRNELSFGAPIYERTIRWMDPADPVEFEVRVESPLGEPMEGVLVGIHFPHSLPLGMPERFQASRYTNAQGIATFLLDNAQFPAHATMSIAVEDHMGSQYAASDIEVDPLVLTKR